MRSMPRAEGGGLRQKTFRPGHLVRSERKAKAKGKQSTPSKTVLRSHAWRHQPPATRPCQRERQPSEGHHINKKKAFGLAGRRAKNAPALYSLDIQCGLTPKILYLGGMKQNNTVEPVQDGNNEPGENLEQIRKWLTQDLKRIQALCHLLQDPIVLDACVNHMHGQMINQQNRKMAAENAKEMGVNHV